MLKPHEESELYIREAINSLRRARDLLRQASAPRSARYVARALKSAEGALRHATRGDIRERKDQAATL